MNEFNHKKKRRKKINSYDNYMIITVVIKTIIIKILANDGILCKY